MCMCVVCVCVCVVCVCNSLCVLYKSIVGELLRGQKFCIKKKEVFICIVYYNLTCIMFLSLWIILLHHINCLQAVSFKTSD